MAYSPVLTKKDFVRRYARGEFGNASPTWDHLDDVPFGWLSTPDNLFHIRNRVTGGPTYYNLPGMVLIGEWTSLVDEGVDPTNLYISVMAPSEKTLFQGEVMQGDCWGLELTYTTIAKPMREAFKESTKTARGVEVLYLLRKYLDVNSQDWLNTLFERYDRHVVEFSTYSVEWGTLPGFNTVFWEVRKY